MIKDPYCETYFPERDGVRLEIDGKEHVFCSTDCRDKFLDAHTNAKAHDD
jgi:YHS domain-containing protein